MATGRVVVKPEGSETFPAVQRQVEALATKASPLVAIDPVDEGLAARSVLRLAPLGEGEVHEEG